MEHIYAQKEVVAVSSSLEVPRQGGQGRAGCHHHDCLLKFRYDWIVGRQALDGQVLIWQKQSLQKCWLLADWLL